MADNPFSLRIDHAEKLRLSKLAQGRGMSLAEAMKRGAAQLLEDPVTESLTAEAVGSTTLKLGPRDETWDAGAATGAMDGAAELQRFNFWHNDGEDPSLKSSYKLPFGTPTGGDHAVWRGVTAGAGRLNQTQGIKTGDVQDKMDVYYRKAADLYDDPSIVAPWSSAAATTEPSSQFAEEMAEAGLVWARDEGWSLSATAEADALLAEFSETAAEANQAAHAYQPDGSGVCSVCGQSEDAPMHTGMMVAVEPEPERKPHVQPAVAAAEVAADSGGWKANPLFFTDQATRDGRVLASTKAAQKIDKSFRGPWWTDTPKTLMAQTINPESGGHALAFVAGTMPGTDIKQKGAKVLASGRFNADENGQMAQQYVDNQSLTGISVDLSPQQWQVEIAPADEGSPMMLFFAAGEDEPVGQEGADPIILKESVDDVTLRFLDYETIGSTLVPTPAFGDAQVALTADGKKIEIAYPGVSNIWIEMGLNDAGWPIPRRVVVGGLVEPWLDDPLIAAADGIRPSSIGELRELVQVLDEAHVARLVSLDEAKHLFLDALRRRAE
jgi:hypothetical protein